MTYEVENHRSINTIGLVHDIEDDSRVRFLQLQSMFALYQNSDDEATHELVGEPLPPAAESSRVGDDVTVVPHVVVSYQNKVSLCDTQSAYPITHVQSWHRHPCW